MAVRTRVVLAIPDPDQLAAATALIEESSELELAATAHAPEQLTAALESTDVDAVVVDESLGVLPIMELIRQLASAFPHVGFIPLLREVSPRALQTALRAGARDVLERPLTLERLQASVGTAAEWADAVRERIETDRGARVEGRAAGRVIAVVGGKGGVGTTTIALNLALAGASQDGDRGACLLELDLQGGDLRTYLDLPPAPHRSLADLTGVAGELGQRALDDVLYAHSSGLRVLLAPEHGEDAEDVSDGLARELIGLLKARASLVVVDLGATLTEAGAATVELADRVLVVATPDVPALRGANRMLRMWRRLHLALADDDVAVTLNRVNRAAEVQPELARRVLLAPLSETVIPAGFRDLEQALNSGSPERLASGPVRDGLSRLAVEVGAQRERPRRLRRARPGSDESGAVSLETAGLAGLVTLIVLLLWQIALAGYTFILAGHSAREAARALAVGENGEETARAEVSGAWREGIGYKEGGGSGDEAAYAEVTLRVPALIPGFESPITVRARESTVIESQALPDAFDRDQGEEARQ
jgi:pilus assembly protein CpaE